MLLNNKKCIEKEHFAVTLRDELESQGLNEEVCRNFIFPMLTTSFGCSEEEIQEFSAYGVIKQLHYGPKGFYAIKGGTAQYLNSLIGRLNKCKLNLTLQYVRCIESITS